MRSFFYLGWNRFYAKGRPWILLSPALVLVVFLFLGGLGFGIAESLNYMPIIGLNEPNFDAYRTIFGEKGYTLYQIKVYPCFQALLQGVYMLINEGTCFQNVCIVAQYLDYY